MNPVLSAPHGVFTIGNLTRRLFLRFGVRFALSRRTLPVLFPTPDSPLTHSVYRCLRARANPFVHDEGGMETTLFQHGPQGGEAARLPTKVPCVRFRQ